MTPSPRPGVERTSKATRQAVSLNVSSHGRSNASRGFGGAAPAAKGGVAGPTRYSLRTHEVVPPDITRFQPAHLPVPYSTTTTTVASAQAPPLRAASRQSERRATPVPPVLPTT